MEKLLSGAQIKRDRTCGPCAIISELLVVERFDAGEPLRSEKLWAELITEPELVATRHVTDHWQNAIAANHIRQVTIPLLNGLLLDQLRCERLLQELLGFSLTLRLCNLAFGFYLGLLQLIFGLLGALLRHLLLLDGACIIG